MSDTTAEDSGSISSSPSFELPLANKKHLSAYSFHNLERMVGLHFRREKKRLRFGLMDELDVSVRYSLCIFGLVAIMVFAPADILSNEFPAVFLLGIAASLVFMTPYFGAAWNTGLSFVLGGFMAVLVAWIVILIAGTGTYPVSDVEMPIACGNSTMLVSGEQGDPSPVGVGAMIFVATFLFSYYAQSFGWAKGSTLLFAVYVLVWYAAIKSPVAPKIGVVQFAKIARTTMLGVACAILWIIVPLPKWNSPLRGTPSSRYAIPVILESLRGASRELEQVFRTLVEAYLQNDSLTVLEATLPQLDVLLASVESKLGSAASLMDTSGRWEPILFPFELRFAMLQKYHSKLALMVLQTRSLMHTMRNRVYLHQMHEIRPWEAIDDDLLHVLDALSVLTSKSMKAGRKRFSAPRDYRSAMNSQVTLLREKTTSIFSDLDLEPELSEIGRERSYQCNCLWKFCNIILTVISLEEMLSKPTGPGYLRRVLDWGLLYLEVWTNGVKDIFNVIRCKQSPRKFINHRYTHLVGSLQIALGALVGSLFVLIGGLRENIPDGYVIVSTIVIIMDRDNPSIQFAKAENRLTGTALAIAGAFFISAFWPQGSSWATLIVLTIYAFVARFVQFNPRYSYSAFSFIVVIFGILFEVSTLVLQSNVQTSTNNRGTATAIGVVIACFCNLLWPVRGRTLIRYFCAKNMLLNFIPLLEATFSIFEMSPEETEPLIPKHLAMFNKGVAKQNVILAGAVAEPLLWRDPVPQAAWNNVIECQKNLFLSAATCLKMNTTFLTRVSESDPSALLRVFGDTVPVWDQFLEEIEHRIFHAAMAVELKTPMISFSRTLREHYVDWAAVVKHQVAEEHLPPNAHVSLWAMVWNCSFLVDDVTRLCAAVDQLYLTVRVAREPGIPCGRVPTCHKSFLFGTKKSYLKH